MLSHILASDHWNEPGYKMTAFLLDAPRWEVFRDTQWAEEGNVIGGPTLEMLYESLRVKFQLPEIKSQEACIDGYYVPLKFKLACQEVVGKEDFFFTYASDESAVQSYWLASPASSDWQPTGGPLFRY